MLFHIVWIPKYRKRVLEGAVAERIRELLIECAEVNDWKVEELNVQKDHVHLLIRLRPIDSVSDAVWRMKGKSSCLIRREFPKLAEFRWGRADSFWADGYFVETVGQVNEARIREYIVNQ